VNLYFDLGRSDSTAIIFEQYVGMQRRVIDFYQNRLKGLDHYIHVLRSRYGSNGELYEYGDCWLPHDARAKTLGSKKSIEEQMREAGFRVRIVPRLSKVDGIIAARGIFPTCWFDASRCEKGLLHSLRHYHYAEDPDKEILSNEPVHDWSSHAADAFRYMAIASSDRGGDRKSRKISSALKKHSGLKGAFQSIGESLGWMA
jgi:phage terminase large subunit